MEICEHLKGILDQELKAGNVITRTFENEWENEAFSVRMKRPLNKNKQEAYLDLSPTITYWENKESRYLPGKGYYCKLCKHTISGPLYYNY